MHTSEQRRPPIKLDRCCFNRCDPIRLVRLSLNNGDDPNWFIEDGSVLK